MDDQGLVCGSEFGSNEVQAVCNETVLLCHPQAIKKCEMLSIYFSMLPPTHLLRLKGETANEKKMKMEKGRKMEYKYSVTKTVVSSGSSAC